jgi:hypothetical protein
MPSRTNRTVDEAVADLVRFFGALPEDARREYEALAELDRQFGEDVVAEQRERARALQS